MDVKHLELLRELSVRGTLAAVADATHRTPSALSQQLRTAEREFGVPLVEPAGRRLRLTAAGQLLADSADEIGELLATVRARLDEVTGQPVGLVKIGAFPSAGEALMPGLVRRLRGTRLRLELDDFDLAEADYAARTLDYDIVIAHSLTADVPPGAERLVSRVLAREPIDVAMPVRHPLARREVLRPRDLVGTRWVGVPTGYPFDTILIAVEHLIGESLERSLRLRDNRLIEALVVAGEGLALLPRFTTRRRAGLTTRPLVGVPSQRAVMALSRGDRHARLAVRTVLDALEQVGGELTDQ